MNKVNLIVPFELDNVAVASAFDDKLAWVKFVFTDDKPNGNKQGIPREEFDNIVRTGLFKPVKGLSPSGSHSQALPVGTIAQLSVEEDKILGVASLWEAEYPEFIESIRALAARGEKPQLSWEIIYRDSEIDSDGVEWLKGCIAKAITIVDNPAYAGRTPILAIAEQGDTMDEKLKELEQTNASLAEELRQAKQELEELRAFKQQVEAERARQELFNKRLAKFEAAGLSMSREEFESTFDKWAALDDDAFEFVLSLLVNEKPTQAAVASLPTATISQSYDPKEVLKEFFAKRSN